MRLVGVRSSQLWALLGYFVFGPHSSWVTRGRQFSGLTYSTNEIREEEQVIKQGECLLNMDGS
jgi:hypothetical protein